MFKLSIYYNKSINEYGCLFAWEKDTARFFVNDIMDLITILKYLDIQNMLELKFNNSNIDPTIQKMILQLISALTQE